MSSSTRAVFLSYASEDSGAAACIADALKTAGIEVWFDKSELRGGDAWDHKIQRQIRECRLFLPIISANSDARPEGYFRLEWRLAVERMRLQSDKVAFLVPISIGDTSERTADAPESFRAVQWTHFKDAQPSREFLARITALLGATAGASPGPAILGSAESVSPAAARRAPPKTWLGAAVLAVVAGIGWLTWHEWGQRSIVPTVAREKSIAVLPFSDLSEKHDQEYFADGLADEVLSLLATLPGLTVISRTSSFQFKGKSADVRTAAAQLGAAYIVEGSVKRAGNRVRVTTQLISAMDGARRWSDTYDRDFDDVLRLQKDIAASLGRALQVEVGGLAEQGALTHPDAYTAYLQGMHAMDRFDEPGLEEAVGYFEQAVSADPRYIRARESLALARYHQYSLGIVIPAVAAENLRRAADEVLRLDPQSATGHALRAEVFITYDWNWAAAEDETRKALTTAKNSEIALYAAGDLASVFERWDEAERLLRQALAADPLDPDARNLLSWTLYRHGRVKEAATEGRRVLEIRPTFVTGHFDLALYLLAGGNHEEALTEMQREFSDTARPIGVALALSSLGRKTEADAELRIAEQVAADEFPYWIAGAHAVRGETEAAFHWLDRAYAQKDFLLEYIKSDPMFKNLVGDPRYKTLLRKMNLPE